MIKTERLILREWLESDFDHFQNLNADPEVMRYIMEPLSRLQTNKLIGRIHKHFEEWGYGLYAAEYRANSQFIGFIGLSHPEFESEFTPCVEIGWRLSSDYWSRGLATEGAQAVLKYAFEVLYLKEIYSFTSIINLRSKRVMQKIGMKKLGTFFHPNLPLADNLCEHWLYRIKVAEYLSDQ